LKIIVYKGGNTLKSQYTKSGARMVTIGEDLDGFQAI